MKAARRCSITRWSCSGAASSAAICIWSTILPIALAGRGKGTLKPGRRLRFATETPLCNLYLSMLHRMGIERRVFRRQHGHAARARAEILWVRSIP